jgi:hypothetical protein
VREAQLAKLQASFNLVTGLWPLLHMRSFEMVSGPKTDKWLVRAVAGLLVTIGLEQLRAASTPGSGPTAKRLGLGTATTMAAIDVTYATKGRISRIYLLDAVIELLIIKGWLRYAGQRAGRSPDEVLTSRGAYSPSRRRGGIRNSIKEQK